MVESLARLAACSSAIASAWGRPPRAVAPWPTILPPFDMITQPTLGLGALWPRAPSPSRSASPIHLRSSVNMECFGELLKLALLFLLGGLLVGHVLLLVGDDVGVGAVRRIQLDFHHLGRRRGPDLRVDHELDDDDQRDQERECSADNMLALAMADEGEEIAKCRARARGARKPGHAAKIGLARGNRQPVPSAL